MTSEKTIIGSIIGITFAIIVGIMFLGGNSAPIPIEAKKVDKGEITRPDSIKRGPDDAKVKITEFLDFQCPACANAHPMMGQVLAERGDKFEFIIRNFPLSNIHANADNAARAAEAAHLQGKYWEMYDKLFATQKDWSAASKSKDTFSTYAKELGLNVEQFSRDFDDQKVVDRIKLDKGDGNALNVNSTPTFFINDEKYDGDVSAQAFIAKIDELAK